MAAIDNFYGNIKKVSSSNLVNFLKIDPSSSSDTCPSLAAGATYTKPVTHNLGYMPFFEVWQEVPGTAAITNAQAQVQFTQALYGSAGFALGYTNAEYFPGYSSFGVIYTTTTQLFIKFKNTTSSTSPAFKFWWRIYLQYGS